MKLALARPLRGQPRFFTGRYDGAFSEGSMTPVTTGAPDKARVYEDRAVAEIIQAFLNVLDGVNAGAMTSPWIIMPLPEQWT